MTCLGYFSVLGLESVASHLHSTTSVSLYTQCFITCLFYLVAYLATMFLSAQGDYHFLFALTNSASVNIFVPTGYCYTFF